MDIKKGDTVNVSGEEYKVTGVDDSTPPAEEKSQMRIVPRKVDDPTICQHCKKPVDSSNRRTKSYHLSDELCHKCYPKYDNLVRAFSNIGLKVRLREACEIAKRIREVSHQ